ncbi:hypothetical protein [Natronolimnohabitans innermongolicus]|uniref:hypothetical protein n=1 Tax=Natronolimnohabitans innermongolicus TaxID=253107 RepID=UPI0012689298|nr:hypothetical protein [Natronolimnohabitans innermongolicus]
MGALVLSLVLVSALFAPLGAGVAGASSAGPSGMLGVPDSQITTVGDEISASDWDVHTDRHASTLEVEIGVGADDELELILSDDENHDGRQVAISRSALIDGLGHAPEKAHGEHSSGDSWSSNVRYEGEWAIFEVPQFSTNPVTFDGNVVITGSDVSDGSQFSYDLEDASAVDDGDGEIVFTGVERENDRTVSDSLQYWESTSLNVAGDRDVTADLTLDASTERYGLVDDDDYLQSDQGGYFSETVPSPNSTVTIELEYMWNQPSGGGDFQFLIEDDGTEIWSETGYSEEGSMESETFELDVSGTDELTLRIDTETSAHEIHQFDIVGEEPTEATVSSNSDSVVFDDFSQTKSLDLNSGSETVDLSANGGIFDLDLEFTERVSTANPSVDINGNTVSYDGSLDSGDSETYGIDRDWLVDGSNELVVNTDSVNGFESVVAFEYSHSASYDQSVSYVGEAWSEQYNISRTWDDATQDASLTIPFSSSRIVDIGDLEHRVNGGSWEPLEDYELDGTTLKAKLGDVSANDEINVRATGSKVDVSGGEINVLEPTTEGNSLDSLIEISEHSDEFAIDVGGTSEGNWLHDTRDESWTSPETTATVHYDGSQELRFPGASDGATTRVTTLPLEVDLRSGSVAIDVIDDGAEPRLDVEPSSTSSVEYTWHETSPGDRYVLFSETHDVARDTGTASSPVTLEGPGYSELLTILHDSDDENETATTSGGGGGGSGPVPTGDSSPIAVLGIVSMVLVGLAYGAHRTGIGQRAVAIVSVPIVLLALEVLGGGAISDATHSILVMVGSQGATVAGSIALLGAIGVLAVVVLRFRERREEAGTPDTVVSLGLGDDDTE